MLILPLKALSPGKSCRLHRASFRQLDISLSTGNTLKAIIRFVRPLHKGRTMHEFDYEQADWPRQVRIYYLQVDHWEPAWHLCLEAFFRSLYYERSESPLTITNYVSTLARFYAGKRTQPGLVTRTDVSTFMFAPTQQGRPPSVGTRNFRLSCLASWYKFASIWTPPGASQVLFDHPVPRAGIRHASPARVYRQFTADELRQLFAVINVEDAAGDAYVIGLRDRALLWLFLQSGRRSNEVLRLRWGDLEHTAFPDGRVGIAFHFKGKGNRGRDLDEYPERAYQELLTYLEAAGRFALMEPGDYLFICHGPQTGGYFIDEGKPMSSGAALARLKHYCQL